MKDLINNTRTLFLWMAGIILLAHGFVPHHHHFETLATNNNCHQECNHTSNTVLGTEVHVQIKIEASNDGHKHASCNGCEFNAKTIFSLSKLSIDIPSCTNSHLQIILFPQDSRTNHPIFVSCHASLLSEAHSLRGPPQIG